MGAQCFAEPEWVARVRTVLFVAPEPEWVARVRTVLFVAHVCSLAHTTSVQLKIVIPCSGVRTITKTFN